jgi:glycosyltransferase involved in cell wall biosynthesis
MTLWFDISDLFIWAEPQLTGIQRTVASVLDELSAARDDVRLFRYSARSQRLEVANRSDLPTLEARAQGRRVTARRSGLPLRQQLGRLIQRHMSEEIASALRDCAGSAEALWRALCHRNSSLSSPLPRAPEPARVPNILPAFFQAGDVCLSMSATWSFPRYGELMARYRAATPFACINLLYDLIPVLHPQWFAPRYADRLAMWARQQMANADLILTISTFQKSEIEAYMQEKDLERRPVRTIRLGDNLKATTTIPARPRYVPARPFVLCVSTIDVRKNHLCLYHVWRRLAEKPSFACPELLLVGMSHESGLDVLRQIRRDPLVKQLIVHVADASDNELAWYYENCLFTAYPSMYEGWGLPIRESLAAGRYCVASDSSSLPEAGGELVDYFDPIDCKACFDLVERALSQPEYVKAREDRIRRTFRPRPWRDTALQISGIVDEMMRRRNANTKPPCFGT